MWPFIPSSIMGVLSNKCGFQLQYQMIFSIWLLAFSPQMCEYLRRYNIVPVLSDILQESVKEKVTRIILAAFRVSSGCGTESLYAEKHSCRREAREGAVAQWENNNNRKTQVQSLTPPGKGSQIVGVGMGIYLPEALESWLQKKIRAQTAALANHLFYD